MSFLLINNVEKRFGSHPVIKGVTIEARQGEFVVFVGPSGCGKSTLLRLVAGLEDVSEGEIVIDGRDVTDLPPANREISMVFQSYALYPHMTVRENISFGLRMAKMPRDAIAARVAEAVRILQLELLLDRKPAALSGGQRQRVAIGRAIVRQPKIFLFDEPLSNLDAELRAQMRVEIARLHRELQVTMVYVTHDQVEAMTLADRIVVLRDGRVEQIGSPTSLYDQPANVFVAGFIGSPRMNFLTVSVTSRDDRTITVSHPSLCNGVATIPRPAQGQVDVGSTLIVGLRPESLTVGDGSPLLELSADFSENLGGSTQIYAKGPDGSFITILASTRCSLKHGQTIRVGLSGGRLYVFDSDGLALD